METNAKLIPNDAHLFAFSFKNIIDKMIVTKGYTEIIGKIIYAGPDRSASKRTNCPPAPNSPTNNPLQIPIKL